MALKDAQRLFDILLRLQLYVEGVKAYESRQFIEVMRAVNEEFKKLLGRIKFKSLDGLTKAELNRLIVTLRKSQIKIYNPFVDKVNKQLKSFMESSLIVNRRIYASVFAVEDDSADEIVILEDKEASELIEDEKDFSPIFGMTAVLVGGSSVMWEKIVNEPMGANGILLNPFLKSFSAAAQVGAENLISKGYSNAWTSTQTIDALSDHLNKSYRQFNSVNSTLIQHIQASVSNGIASALWGRYKWISVLDSGTTEICRSRSQKIYEYGKGPLPPAHVGCRSMTIPFIGAENLKETFNSFINRQPAVIKKLFGGNFERLTNPLPVTLNQFQKAVPTIIGA